ncbi:MAG: 16S rRNA (adenine(1518)-N(6)/adenine(1519)-N(6))-dimethyltransferase RsmA [Chitinophagales bacterium]|nr:16S rRNA (adenine(1518)-N(6)/adenine(1519)-N(6))-dimethyltransferase RsmA [Chitinophagales bacterium]
MQRVQPNKNYGQHFLKDKTVVQRTVEIIKSLHHAEKLIEIGPGTGALTSALIPEFIDILNCIEVDERCVEYLHTHYIELQNKIIHKDFLKVPLEEILFPSATIVGNFPYNISSQIIFKILEYREKIPNMIGMFQKEVAVRIAAPHSNKEYGILSVLTQLYYDAKIAFDIPPGAFNPPPKVMSSVLILTRKENPLQVNYPLFVKVVKAGFNQRRKMLRNALSQVAPPEILKEDIFQKRAEQLSVEDFVELTNRIENLQ